MKKILLALSSTALLLPVTTNAVIPVWPLKASHSAQNELLLLGGIGPMYITSQESSLVQQAGRMGLTGNKLTQVLNDFLNYGDAGETFGDYLRSLNSLNTFGAYNDWNFVGHIGSVWQGGQEKGEMNSIGALFSFSLGSLSKTNVNENKTISFMTPNGTTQLAALDVFAQEDWGIDLQGPMLVTLNNHWEFAIVPQLSLIKKEGQFLEQFTPNGFQEEQAAASTVLDYVFDGIANFGLNGHYRWKRFGVSAQVLFGLGYRGTESELSQGSGDSSDLFFPPAFKVVMGEFNPYVAEALGSPMFGYFGDDQTTVTNTWESNMLFAISGAVAVDFDIRKDMALEISTAGTFRNILWENYTASIMNVQDKKLSEFSWNLNATFLYYMH